MDPELERTFEKLGIPVNERKALAGYAVDAVVDSVSVKTTTKRPWQRKALSSAPLARR